MGQKIWVCASNAKDEFVRELVRKFGFPRPVAILLAARGIKAESVDTFIKSSLSSLSDPFRFPGMREAVVRLWQAVRKREKILIHGDYDTDGVTATALLASVLRDNGADVSTFLPHRIDDGYGFTPESLEKALESIDSDCGVLVTVDCGINSIEAARDAKQRGIDVIITDHHEPGPEAPDALALLNPKLHDSLEDLHLLSGAGVSFKLSHAFINHGRENNLGAFSTDLNNILDLAALGTIADIVPLLGENRILVKNGMTILRKQIRPGVRALIESARVRTNLKTSDITYKLAPRINAAGRLGNANIALQLLESENIVEAYKYADMLEKFNTERQQKEHEIYHEAKNQIEKNIDIENSFSILAAGADWHQGVIGIVASRLARDFNRPAVVLTIQNGEAYGSGRSIGTLNLVEILSKTAHLLERFGGHPMAVGLALQSSKIQEFYKLMEENIRHELTRDDLVDTLQYDGEINVDELDSEFFRYLDMLGPFGHSNTRPLFRFNTVEPVKKMNAGVKHSRGVIRDSRHGAIDFIAFNRPLDTLPSPPWDIVSVPQLNEYYSEKKPQLQIIDIRQSI